MNDDDYPLGERPSPERRKRAKEIMARHPDIDGVFFFAARRPVERGRAVYSGFIYGDKKKRFEDGTLVTTSMVVGKIATFGSTKLARFIKFRTLNSVYYAQVLTKAGRDMILTAGTPAAQKAALKALNADIPNDPSQSAA